MDPPGRNASDRKSEKMQNNVKINLCRNDFGDLCANILVFPLFCIFADFLLLSFRPRGSNLKNSTSGQSVFNRSMIYYKYSHLQLLNRKYPKIAEKLKNENNFYGTLCIFYGFRLNYKVKFLSRGTKLWARCKSLMFFYLPSKYYQ